MICLRVRWANLNQNTVIIPKLRDPHNMCHQPRHTMTPRTSLIHSATLPIPSFGSSYELLAHKTAPCGLFALPDQRE